MSDWLDCIPQYPPKALHHGAVWKPTETNSAFFEQAPSPNEVGPVLYTCAPPPGWVVSNGITVPPTSIPHKQEMDGIFCDNGQMDAASLSSISRREFFDFYGVTDFHDRGDELLGIWFCASCYLDPSEKPPDFDSCWCCLEIYYFPFPPNLPKSWICPGCKRLQNEEFPVFRHCNQCGKEEEITMHLPLGSI